MNSGFDENKTTSGLSGRVTEPEFLAAAAPKIAAGQLISEKYRVVEFIGHGAAGFVYKVEQVFLLRKFALKLFDGRNTGNAIIRFQKEAQMSGQLNHPNLVRATDFGVINGDQPFLVMDLVDGPALDLLLKTRGVLSVSDVSSIMRPVCLALEYAHEKGLVHRDIKPGNIMLDGHSEASLGTPKVVDFGIAKLLQDTGLNLTRTGEVFGTPLYMSPEQCAGHSVDARSDIYSLGCVLYELLTGAPPFRGAGVVETVSMHMYSKPLSLREASLGRPIPDAYEYIVQKMLSKDPADRYQNCGQLFQDLTAADMGTLAVPDTMKSAPLFGSKSVQAGKSGIVQTSKKETNQKQPQNLVLAALGIFATAVVGGAGYLAFMAVKNDRPPVGASEAARSENSDPASAGPQAANSGNSSDVKSEAKNTAPETSKSNALQGADYPPLEAIPDAGRIMAPTVKRFPPSYLTSHSDGMRMFEFLDGVSIGRLYIYDPATGRPSQIDAKGPFAQTGDCQLELHLNLPLFEAYPDKLLAPFPPNELWGLKVAHDARSSFPYPHLNNDLKYLAKFKYLGDLRLECPELTEEGFGNLEVQNMRNLIELTIRYGNVSMSTIAKLPMLHNIKNSNLKIFMVWQILCWRGCRAIPR
ncbi:MAG TPA: protein kinase [Oculatellaceae cyanobacterium]